MEEKWKPIRYYEGLYEVSSLGRVKSFWKGELLMKPIINDSGYLRVFLRKDGSSKTYRIHRLVAEAFIEKTDYSQNFVDHINHVTTDNSVGNLRWTTRSQNCMNQIVTTRNTSGHKGVSWSKQFNKWIANINVNKKKVFTVDYLKIKNKQLKSVKNLKKSTLVSIITRKHKFSKTSKFFI